MHARHLRTLSNSLTQIHWEYLIKKGYRPVPFYEDSTSYLESLGEGQQRYFEVEINNFPFIDYTDLSWNHIIELRKDPDFVIKLRNLRVFYLDELKNKEKEHAIDILLSRINQFNEKCHSWGLKTTLSTLSQVINSKTLLGNLALVAASILANDSSLIKASTISALSIEIGKFVISFSEKLIAKRDLVINDPVSYLVEIEKMTSPNNRGQGTQRSHQP